MSSSGFLLEVRGESKIIVAITGFSQVNQVWSLGLYLVVTHVMLSSALTSVSVTHVTGGHTLRPARTQEVTSLAVDHITAPLIRSDK